MNMKVVLLTAAILSAGLSISAHADIVNEKMPVTITIDNACLISTAPTTLNFGAQGVLAENVDNTSTMSVTCTTGTTYSIGLDAGENGSGNVDKRTMSSGTDFIAYQLYSDSARATVWGDTIGTDTVKSEGTGSAQLYTVYGRVPPQATPPAGVYNDTVLVTLTF